MSMCQSGEQFAKVAHVKVPETSKACVDESLGLKEGRGEMFEGLFLCSVYK